MTHHISGNAVYRATEMNVKVMKSVTFKQKMTTEIQYSQSPLYGRLWRRVETMPVPMITENHLSNKFKHSTLILYWIEIYRSESMRSSAHDGVKFRTTFLHPRSSLDFW